MADDDPDLSAVLNEAEELSQSMSEHTATKQNELNDEEAFLAAVTATEIAAVEYLQGKGCLKKNVKCFKEDCDAIMEIYTDRRGFCVFRCTNHKGVQVYKGVKWGSFWSDKFWDKTIILFTTIIKLNLCWSKFMTMEETVEEIGLDLMYVRRAYAQIRGICQKWVENSPYVIGGSGCEVYVEILEHQIDRKSNTKAKLICGFAPGDDRGFVHFTNDLSEESIFEQVRKYVAPGSVLLSCSWDHSSLPEITPFVAGFKKRSQPNLASKYWTRLKSRRQDRFRGVPLKNLNSYMQELMWREIHDTQGPLSTLEALFDLISYELSEEEIPKTISAKKEKKDEKTIVHYPLPDDPTEAAQIFSIVNNELATIEYLQERGCLRKAATCPFEDCDRMMTKVCHGASYLFRCPKHHGRKLSLRTRSFWENANHSLCLNTKLLISWARRFCSADSCEHVNLSPFHVMKHYRRLREVCANWLDKYFPVLGGPDKVIQLEMFDHRVDGRKAIKERIVLGYSPSDDRCFVRCTQDLSSENLCSFVKKYVAPGSVILSSSWEEYASVQDIDVDPGYVAGPRKQSKPNLVSEHWIRVRDTVGFGRRFSSYLHYIDSFLQEYMWRTIHDQEGLIKTLEAILSHISEQWDVYADEKYGNRDMENAPQANSVSNLPSSGERPASPSGAQQNEQENPEESSSPSKMLMEPITQLTEYSYDDVTTIVKPEEVLSDNLILAENVNLGELCVALKDHAAAVQWCVKHR